VDVFRKNIDVYPRHWSIVSKALEKQLDEIKLFCEDLKDCKNSGKFYITDGVGRSGIIAKTAAYDLRHGLGINAFYQGWHKTPHWKSGEYLESFSASGSTKPVVRRAIMARKDGLKIRCLTSNPKSKLAEIAELVIYIPGREKSVVEAERGKWISPMGNLSEFSFYGVSMCREIAFAQTKRGCNFEDEFLQYAGELEDYLEECRDELFAQEDKIDHLIEDIRDKRLLLVCGVGPHSGGVGQCFEMRMTHAGYSEREKEREVLFVDSENFPLVQLKLHQLKKEDVRVFLVSHEYEEKISKSFFEQLFFEWNLLEVSYILTSSPRAMKEFGERAIYIPSRTFKLSSDYEVSFFYPVALLTADSIACSCAKLNNVIMEERHKVE